MHSLFLGATVRILYSRESIKYKKIPKRGFFCTLLRGSDAFRTLDWAQIGNELSVLTSLFREKFSNALVGI